MTVTRPTRTSVKIMRGAGDAMKKSKTNRTQSVRKNEKTLAGLVDDGWGGLVQETESKYLVKDVDAVGHETVGEAHEAVKQNVADKRFVRDPNPMVQDLSEMGRDGDEEVQEVRKRTVVEDRLEKLRLYGEQDSRGSRGSSQRRSTTDGRRRGRGRILCLDWQKGRCTYGSSCKFMHDEDVGYDTMRNDSRSPEGTPRSRGICFNWQNGRCRRGARCRFSHEGEPRERAPDVCFDFKKGRCLRGETCKFSHITGREDACFDFKNGRCFRGEQCRFSHESYNNGFAERRRSRGVCYDWQKGICRRGHSCRFEHEESSSPNIGNDGFRTIRQSKADWSDDYESDYTKKETVPSYKVYTARDASTYRGKTFVRGRHEDTNGENYYNED